MNRIRGRDTGPEKQVRSCLHRLGFRFSLRSNDLPGKPDIVLCSRRTAVFVHGCFWHRHARCKNSVLPKTREDFWLAKLTANVEREKDPSEFQIPHALELTNIRLVLLRTGTLWSWIPESLIRVLNLSPALAYAKVYDGIAKVFLDREFVEFAVEYERTLKSLPKYEKIREAIESEKRLKAFLYLVPSWQLMSTLRGEFWDTRRMVFFGLVSEFKEKAFDAAVSTAMYDQMPLQAALQKVAALAKAHP
jgi:DNA mismatch endonuclease Vsr